MTRLDHVRVPSFDVTRAITIFFIILGKKIKFLTKSDLNQSSFHELLDQRII